MIKQLRKRIMLTMFLMLSIIFVSILVAINIFNATRSRNEADSMLHSILQREMRFKNSRQENMPDSPQHNRKPPEEDKPEVSDPDLEQRMEIIGSHFILVRYDSENGKETIENTLSDSYTDDVIKEYCNQILEEGKMSGTTNHLRYLVRHDDGNTVIAFIDYTSNEQSRKNVLIASGFSGLAGLIAFAFLSLWISGLMVKPVENAFEKQKQFISDASHELKTPITVILSNSELLEDQIGENKQLSYIKKECDRMHHLVTSLLTLTHLEQAQHAPADKSDFSLSDALLEQILPMESVAFERGITMVENIDSDITFYGVKEQLQQVADILIDNALAYTKKGGEIHISLNRTPHHITFTVSNTGEEIPPDERERLFERFYRQDKARNRSGGHFGLGLSIASTIVARHRGRIHVESADGFNSFIVTLKTSDK